MNLEILTSNETDKTPNVSLDSTTGVLEIGGVSIPEDTLAFYEPIFKWLDNYLEKPAGSTVLTVEMKFFNTSSSKCLYTIFRKLETLHQKGRSVKIKWCYKLEDTDMYESGQDFKNLVAAPFVIERC
jgi:hypothetical protein